MKADEACLRKIAKNAQPLRDEYCIQTLTILVSETQTILTHTYEDGEVITLCTINNGHQTTRMHKNTPGKRKTTPESTLNG